MYTTRTPTRSEPRVSEYNILTYIRNLSLTCPRLSEAESDFREVTEVENDEEDRRRRPGTWPDRARSRRSCSIKALLLHHSRANIAKPRRVPSRSMSDSDSQPPQDHMSKISCRSFRRTLPDSSDSLEIRKYAFIRVKFSMPLNVQTNIGQSDAAAISVLGRCITYFSFTMIR